MRACLDPNHKGHAIYEHCVEKGGESYLLRQIEHAKGKTASQQPMLLKKSSAKGGGRCDDEHAGRCRGSGWHRLHRHRDELGKLAEVLGCGGEVELVPGAVRAA